MPKINAKQLKTCIKLINDSGLLKKIDEKNIRVVGVKTDVLKDDFGDVVDLLADAELIEKLPEEVVTMYNELFGDGDGEKEETDPEPEEVEKEEPKEKEKPKPKAKGTGKSRSCYGHIASAKSGALDVMLQEGATYAELMDECEVKLHRVKGHINVLRKLGLTVLTKEDKDDAKNTHVKIKEKSLER